jgi:hypothetical protein
VTPDPYQGESLTDDDLQSEIELVGDLVVAASSSEGPLSEAEIDRLLGIEPRPAKAHRGRRPRTAATPA